VQRLVMVEEQLAVLASKARLVVAALAVPVAVAVFEVVTHHLVEQTHHRRQPWLGVAR